MSKIIQKVLQPVYVKTGLFSKILIGTAIVTLYEPYGRNFSISDVKLHKNLQEQHLY